MYEGFSSFLSQTVSSEKNKNLQVSRLFSRYKKLQRRRKVLSPRCSAGAKTGSSRREPVIAPAEHPGAACAPSPFLVERALGVLARQRLEHRVGPEKRLPNVRGRVVANVWQISARFRLYRHRSSHVNTRFSAFFKI